MTEYKGTHITDQDSTPPDVVSGKLNGGVIRRWVDAFEVADNGNGDYQVLFKLPIDLVVSKVNFACDNLSSGTVDVGLYKSDGDGTYSAVDDNCFADALALGSGAVAKTDVTYEAAATDISKAMQPLWQRAGLSARPSYGDLYLTLTFDTGTGATGTILAEVEGV